MKNIFAKLSRRPAHCAHCGQKIGTHLPALTYAAPSLWRDRYEGKPGFFLDSDFCIIHNKSFFIRTTLHIPIIDSKESLDWGVWVSVSEKNFKRYRKVYGTPQELDEPAYFGWFNNQLEGYAPTSGIKTSVHLQGGGLRPVLELDHQNPHAICQEQHSGITIQRAHEIVEQSLRFNS